MKTTAREGAPACPRGAEPPRGAAALTDVRPRGARNAHTRLLLTMASVARDELLTGAAPAIGAPGARRRPGVTRARCLGIAGLGAPDPEPCVRPEARSEPRSQAAALVIRLARVARSRWRYGIATVGARRTIRCSRGGVRIAARDEATRAETKRCLATSTASGLSPKREPARRSCVRREAAALTSRVQRPLRRSKEWPHDRLGRRRA